MKKYVTLSIILIIMCVCTTYAQNQDLFINALRNCTPYNSSGDVVINGVTTTTNKQMQGWHDGKCTYKETILYGDYNITTVCRFTKEQIHEIVSVADAYYLTQEYSNEEIDTSSPEAIKNNPFANVMSKYLQDPSVCTIEGLK